MRPLHPLICLAMAAFLAGCQSTSTAKSTGSDTNICNADAVQHFIGKTATADLLEKARSQAGANVARILRPDDVVTLEYNSHRLNLNTDTSLTIERINCG